MGIFIVRYITQSELVKRELMMENYLKKSKYRRRDIVI